MADVERVITYVIYAGWVALGLMALCVVGIILDTWLTERRQRRAICTHSDTYELPEPWPTGESIEVCNCCGMSRAHWEQGESSWQQVDQYQGRRLVARMVDAAIYRAQHGHDSEEHC